MCSSLWLNMYTLELWEFLINKKCLYTVQSDWKKNVSNWVKGIVPVALFTYYTILV